MSLYGIAAFSAAMFLLAVTPGPGVFVTVAKALASGWQKTVPVIAGIVAGDLLFLLAAIYGLAAVAETFGTLFVVIKYLGAAYLVWLGVRLWRTHPQSVKVSASARYGFLSALSITLGNPKVILFYLGFLPTFMDLNALKGTDVFAVAFAVTFILGTVMLSYAYAASRAREAFKSERAPRRMNRVAGSVMIGAGAFLASKA